MALITADGRPPLFFDNTTQQEAKSMIFLGLSLLFINDVSVLPNLETGTTEAESSPGKQVLKRQHPPRAPMKCNQSRRKDDRAALVPLTAHLPPLIKML